MGAERGGFSFRKMRTCLLLALALTGVVMCNTVSIGEGEVQPLGESAGVGVGAGEYKVVDAASYKDLLQVPGIPKGHKILHRISDVTETSCKNACDSDKKCSGFQYVSAEQLCKLLR